MTDSNKVTAGDSSKTTILNSMNAIAVEGYKALTSVHDARSAIMAEVQKAAQGKDSNISIQLNGGTTTEIDISTGAGALVLDDVLQELSTIEQAAAQLVAAENKAQKQVHSVTGQG